MKRVAIFWPGDYRDRPNQWARPQITEATEQLQKALRKLGRKPYLVRGFLTRPDEAIAKLGPIDDPIIGTPRIAEGMVVVVDQSGLYVGLNPENGEKEGAGYRLRGSVAPVAGAVAFSKGRLLAPLSDGTVMLLSGWRLVDVKKK